MERVTKTTLIGICDTMASHRWSDEEIEELVNPQLGIITGFQGLLDELEQLRKIDLGDVAPAMGVRGVDHHE